MRPTAILLAMVLLGAGGAAEAQTVRIEGEVRHATVDSLRAILQRNEYRLVDRDTVLPPATRLTGDLLVVAATVRLEGSVDGAVAVVGGTLFLRPGARVDGSIVSLGGLVLPSGDAAFGDTLSLPLEAGATVARQDGDYLLTLRPPPRRPWVVPSGLFGLWLPGYDRVDALSIRYRTRVNVGADSLAPHLLLGAAFHTARGALDASAALRVPLGRGARLTLEGARATLTNEAWIRGELANSAAAFFARSDARDYHASDLAAVTLESRHGEALVAGEGYVAPRLRLLASRDRSLRVRNVWTVLDRDEPWRPNPPVTEGTILSATAGARVRWQGNASQLQGDVAAEVGRLTPDDDPGLVVPNEAAGSSTEAGETTFTQLVADARWSMTALWGHTIAVHGHLLQPLGSAASPPQRRSFVGGPGTLPTFPYAALRGDHLVFLASSYLAPIPGVYLPLVGTPALVLSHAVGAAWETGDRAPALEQNLGAGLQFSFVYATLYFDPARRERPTLSVGLTLP
jgi:hypothetical protein